MTITMFDPANPLRFFHTLTRDFGTTLADKRGAPDLAGELMQQVFAIFEENVACQCAGEAALACRGGCAACCTLRVTATAPEILAVATYLRQAAATMPSFGQILQQRIAAATEVTAGLDDAQYMMLEQTCPFIVDGHCVIYDVRPLACRGHASFDEDACREAIFGEGDAVPVSQPHLLLRSYIQNAMQSALRDANLAWAIHEFVPALATALHEDATNAWTKGEDPLASSRAEDVSLAEMAATFDEIKALAR
jgi:Fe-S-cluster containining protein